MPEDIRTDLRPAIDKVARHFEALKANAVNELEWQLYDDLQRQAESELVQVAVAVHLFGQ